MPKKVLIFSSIILSLLIAKSGYCEDSPESILIPYIKSNGLVVVTGTGSDVFNLPAKKSSKPDWEGQQKLEYGFSDPNVNPKQDKLIVVRHNEFDPNEHPYRGDCDLVEISIRHPKTSAEVKVLFHAEEDDIISSPVWSPDGRQIAMFLGSQSSQYSSLYILDRETQAVLRKNEIDQKRGTALREYLRWSADGKKIFFWSPRSRLNQARDHNVKDDIGEINLDSSEIKWLDIQTENLENLANSDAVRSLLGPAGLSVIRESFKFPRPISVRSPIWSQDQKYFFSFPVVTDSGKTAQLERLDVKTGDKKVIKVLWHDPYGL